MARRNLTENKAYAEAFEQALTRLILAGNLEELPEDPEDEVYPEANTIETYKEAGHLTGNRGLVVRLSDGAEVHLTITAYTPQGR